MKEHTSIVKENKIVQSINKDDRHGRHPGSFGGTNVLFYFEQKTVLLSCFIVLRVQAQFSDHLCGVIQLKLTFEGKHHVMKIPEFSLLVGGLRHPSCGECLLIINAKKIPMNPLDLARMFILFFQEEISMSESFVGFFLFRGQPIGSVKPAEQNKIRCQGDDRDR